MPTIIDELIVSLKLDPRLFNQGQQQAVGQLQNLQATAAQTSTNIQRGPFSRMRQWWTSTFQPVTAANTALVNIGNQSRRTGLQVQAGAKTGQYSLLAMAAAGTAAYAAIKSVQEAFRAVTSTIAGTAAQGNLAGRLGVSPNWLSRLQVAGRRSSALVPAEETSGSLQTLVNFFTGIPLGEVDQGRIRALGMLGVNIGKKQGENQQDFLQRILEESADRLAEIRRTKGQEEAQRLGEMAGYTPRFAQFLSGGSAALRRGQQDAGGVAVTDKMAKSAGELEQAIARAATAWDGLIQKFQTAHPELTQIVNQFAKWLEDVQNSPEALDKLGAAATFVIGGTLVAMVTKFVQAVVAGNAVFLKTPLGMMIAGALGLYTLFESLPEGSQEKKNWEKLRRDPSDLSGGPLRGLSPGYRGEGPTGRMRGDAAYAQIPSGGGGATQPLGRGETGSLERGVQFFMGKGLSRDQAIGVVARLAAESGGGRRLDPNAVNPTSGAYGIAQWLGSRKPAALATAGDVDKQLELVWSELNGSERSALAKIKRSRTAAEAAIAMESFERAGNPAFTAHAAMIAQRMANGSFGGKDASTASGASSRPYLGPGVKYNSRGEAYSAELETMSATEKANVAASMAAIKAAQSAGKPWYGGSTEAGVTNHNYGDVPISRIEVHTQATDALGIGGAIGNAVKTSLQTAQANVGLE